ncbi:fimbrial protein [Enterobacter wuhouensis]|uniref:fimbrial protein n=1 Tax=Enterobacter wuhouensis TaxID=2529381 RepID=UPI002FD5B3FC
MIHLSTQSLRTRPESWILLIGLLCLSRGSLAANVTAGQFTISGTVLAPTCTFSSDHQIVNLEEVSVRDFTNTDVVAEVPVEVSFTCGPSLSSVRIVASGESAPGMNTSFNNTGSARNVALRFMKDSRSPMSPDGSESVTVPVANGSGSYTFLAGYIATPQAGAPGAGTFVSSVALTFQYN